MKKYSLLIGRWQPFHKGHKALVQMVLDEGKNVLIAIRDTQISDKDPYTITEREDMIRKAFSNDQDRIRIIVIPDISEVVYGRNVGYGVREFKLPAEIENISGTKIRNGDIENNIDN